MITKSYNPSTLEKYLISAIKSLETQIVDQLPNNELIETKVRLERDNPDVLFRLKDQDGHFHELVLKVIQRDDEDVNK